MSNCITKLPHSCGSRDGLQVFGRDDDTVDGYCFSCKTYVRHPYDKPKEVKDVEGAEVKSDEETQLEIEEITSLKTFDVPSKKLRKETLEKYGVKVIVSEEDGVTPTMLCYPVTRKSELVGYKLKNLNPKRMWTVGSTKEADPFGWPQALSSGAGALLITEGEDDCIAWRRTLDMLAGKYSDYYTVVSLPTGAASAQKVFSRLSSEFRIFKEVIISFDMDKAGRKAVEDVLTIFPSVKSLDIPCKDANECIIQGKMKELYNSLSKRNTPIKNTRLVTGADVWEEGSVAPKWGNLSWPWQHINNEMRGLRTGEVGYIGAGVKMGKSELVNSMAAHFIMNDKAPVLMAKPEEANRETIQRVAGKAVGKVFHDPKVGFDHEAYNQARELLNPIDKNIFMIDLYQHLGWETLKQDIICAASFGVKVVFIDPITNLTYGIDSGEANTKLEAIAVESASMARDLDILIIFLCHLRAHDGFSSLEAREKRYREGKYIGLGNCPHERGGSIYSPQFAGSRAMMRACQWMIGLEGNKDETLPDEVQRIRNLTILEDRKFGATGVFPILFSRATGQYKEISYNGTG